MTESIHEIERQALEALKRSHSRRQAEIKRQQRLDRYVTIAVGFGIFVALIAGVVLLGGILLGILSLFGPTP